MKRLPALLSYLQALRFSRMEMLGAFMVLFNLDWQQQGDTVYLRVGALP